MVEQPTREQVETKLQLAERRAASSTAHPSHIDYAEGEAEALRWVLEKFYGVKGKTFESVEMDGTEIKTTTREWVLLLRRGPEARWATENGEGTRKLGLAMRFHEHRDAMDHAIRMNRLEARVFPVKTVTEVPLDTSG